MTQLMADIGREMSLVNLVPRILMHMTILNEDVKDLSSSMSGSSEQNEKVANVGQEARTSVTCQTLHFANYIAWFFKIGDKLKVAKHVCDSNK